MEFTCSECGGKTDVKDIHISKELCSDCREMVDGWTVPECIVCDSRPFNKPMVQIDLDTYVCPDCGAYRSSKNKHLTKGSNNPGIICPVLRKKVNIRNLDDHHWHYPSMNGWHEVVIKISRQAHKKIHGGKTLLEQQREQKSTNHFEPMLKNLISEDLARISSEHPYHSIRCGPEYIEHILTRYAFPKYYTVDDISDSFGLPDHIEISEGLRNKRQRLQQRRKEELDE